MKKRGILDAIDNLKKVNEEEQSIKDMLNVKTYSNHTKTNEENDKMLSLEATKMYFEEKEIKEYDAILVKTDNKRNNYMVFLGNEKFKGDKK